MRARGNCRYHGSYATYDRLGLVGGLHLSLAERKGNEYT
jgi:hypothetical protein